MAGNLLPVALAAIPLLIGIRLAIRTGDTLGPALAWVAASPIVGWLAANLFGLVGNGALRREVAQRVPHPRAALFVGFASPGHWGLLDAHEDVGFLYWTEDRIVFAGERAQVVLPRSGVRRVGFRPNPHTWALLGGWVCVEAEVDGKRARLLIEPRERATLIGNARLSRRLIRELRSWASAGGATPTTERSR
ncbi:MAG: hypothetical protein ACK41F_04295 [Fimbriimonadaceae bacterium]